MNSADTLNTTGALLVKGFINPTEINKKIFEMESVGKGINDQFIPGATAFYKQDIFEELLDNMRPVVERLTGRNLLKTYSFARRYVLGNILRCHTDRAACEYTVTVALQHSGEIWPIWVLDNDERPVSFELEPGDALIFKGVQRAHWREKNTFGDCFQVFLHYVDKNGPFAIHQNDRAARRSLRFRFLKRNVSLIVDRIYKF